MHFAVLKIDWMRLGELRCSQGEREWERRDAKRSG